MLFTNAGLWIFVAGVLLLAGEGGALRGSALVAELKAKAKAALLNPTETVEEVVTVDPEGVVNGTNGTAANVTISKTKSLLTGNPQKDYIYDPNLPRELNGYNLSTYPFYNGVPDDIDFKCDDLHDGFYASVPHKCQVYHHCLFGTRYDFLCANYTAFDQRTFICHFVSEVDCDNSPKFFQRNEALYKAATTTSAPIVLMTTTTTTTPQPATAATPRPRRRRPYRRRRPVYEYYYDEYDDDEYYDDDPPPPPPRRKMNRKHRPHGTFRDEDDDYYEGRRDSSRGDDSRGEGSRGEGSRGEGSRAEGSRGDYRGESARVDSRESRPTLRISGPASGTVYDQPRVPPKIRRPVPIHEREKYDYTQKTSDSGAPPTQDPKKNTKPPPKQDEEDEYYDEEYEDDYVKPPPKRSKPTVDHSSDTAGKSDSRRPNNRQRPRQHSRRRPDRFEDDYEEDRPTRSRKRTRHDSRPPTNRGSYGNSRGYPRDEPDPVPAERPGFISSGRFSSGGKKRTEDDKSQLSSKRPSTREVYDDDVEEDEYYDDDEEDVQEEEVSEKNYRPSSSQNGRRNGDYETNGPRMHTNRKQSTVATSPKPNSRTPVTFNQEKSTYQAPSRSGGEGQCKQNCDEESIEDSGLSKKGIVKGNERDSQKRNNERDRVFSSRFRDSLTEGKIKQQTTTLTGQSNSRTSTQSPEPPQRNTKVSSVRSRIANENIQQTPISSTTNQPLDLSEDYSDESSTSSGTKYSNFRSKGRITPASSLSNNYKLEPSTESPTPVSEFYINEKSQDEKSQVPDEPGNLPDEKAPDSQRPYSGYAGRPSKQTPSPSLQDDVTTKAYSVGINYRQPSIVNDEEDTSVRKVPFTGQNYRRVKVDPFHVDNTDTMHSRSPIMSGKAKRPSKTGEEREEESYTPESNQNSEDNVRKGTNFEKPQDGSGIAGTYRRVKISAIPANPEADSTIPSNENVQSLQESPVINPINNYKRPYLVTRPLSSYPVVVEDSTKNTLSLNGPFRRPYKQRIPELDKSLPSEQYTPSVANTGNIRSSIAYFPPKRGKVRIDENSATGLEQYSKQLDSNQEAQFPKRLPTIDITAPGPSGPNVDLATVNYKTDYNSAPSGFPLDIPEEEYDVTLNDALQPSTLHPTRSLVDYQQGRLKSRDYQSNVRRSPEYVSRGRISYLVPAASQQYVTRVQSVFTPDDEDESPITARSSKKASTLDQEEYPAIVHAAPTQRRNRPTEWFW